MKKNKGDLIFGLSVTIATVLIFGSLFIFKDKFQKDDDSGSSFTLETVHNLDITNEPILGDPNAPVTIVEFGDYKCPACGFFTNNIFPQLDSEYIATGKVKFVFKNYPFIFEDSGRAALFTEGVFTELGNEAFWTMNEKIYAHQNVIYSGNDFSNEHKDIYTEKFLNETAEELFGKDKSKSLKDVLDNDKFKKEVNNDLDEAKDVNVSGTPTLFVNGKIVVDSMNYEIIKGAIEEALNTEGK